MEKIKISKDNTVKLFVKISSDAITGSNISIDDVIVKKSVQSSFNTDLGNINDLNNKTLSVAL